MFYEVPEVKVIIQVMDLQQRETRDGSQLQPTDIVDDSIQLRPSSTDVHSPEFPEAGLVFGKNDYMEEFEKINTPHTKTDNIYALNVPLCLRSVTCTSNSCPTDFRTECQYPTLMQQSDDIFNIFEEFTKRRRLENEILKKEWLKADYATKAKLCDDVFLKLSVEEVIYKIGSYLKQTEENKGKFMKLIFELCEQLVSNGTVKRKFYLVFSTELWGATFEIDDMPFWNCCIQYFYIDEPITNLQDEVVCEHEINANPLFGGPKDFFYYKAFTYHLKNNYMLFRGQGIKKNIKEMMTEQMASVRVLLEEHNDLHISKAALTAEKAILLHRANEILKLDKKCEEGLWHEDIQTNRGE